MGNWNLLGWTLTWIFNKLFYTETEKSSNSFFTNLWILNQDQRNGNEKKLAGKEWEKFGSMGNGKPAGFLVIGEPKLWHNPCFIMECFCFYFFLNYRIKKEQKKRSVQKVLFWINCKLFFINCNLKKINK